jgi:urease gamma subunit
VSTLTLEAVRDGIEDFQLLKMAEEVLGKEETMMYVNRVTTSLAEFITESDLFAQIRVELGNALEAAMAK